MSLSQLPAAMPHTREFRDKLRIKLKSAYLHITLTRFTTAFFLFGLLHCFVQVIINGMLFTVDARSLALLTGITMKANVPVHREFAWLRGHQGDRRLSVCHDIPLDLRGRPEPCRIVFRNADALDSNLYPPPLVMSWHSLASVNISVIPTPENPDTSVQAVKLLYDYGRASTTLSPQCSLVLMYARQVVMNFKREDIAIVVFQFWLFGISFISVMYDSVPHMIAVLVSRALITGWSAYTTWRTASLKGRFTDLFIGRGTACGVDLGFGEYFAEKIRFEIPNLLLNVTALCISSYLSIYLLKAYKRQTFKRVGVSSNIMRSYRFFMAKLVCLQLCVFVLMAAISLWIDQLYNSSVAAISEHTPVYKGLFYFTALLMVPWLVVGWWAIRREIRGLMLGHMGLTILFIIFWSVMFYSQVYRWTFMVWPFVACMTVASFFLLITSIILGVMCLSNFNKGLRHYLYVEDKLASIDFEAEVFPSIPERRKAQREGAEEEASIYYVQSLELGDGFAKHIKRESTSTM